MAMPWTRPTESEAEGAVAEREGGSEIRDVFGQPGSYFESAFVWPETAHSSPLDGQISIRSRASGSTANWNLIELRERGKSGTQQERKATVAEDVLGRVPG